MNERHRAGLARRRKVMGDEFVARALAQPGEFSREWQDFVTEYAWGAVWGRPGLNLRSRSLATLAILVALGRSHELTGHLRGALNNGLTPTEIREVIFHSAVYCGIPLAAEALRCAEKVFAGSSAPNNGP